MDQVVDLTSCDREPIHIPGTVQPQGCLLACDFRGRMVVRRSDNVQSMLGLSEDPLNRPLADVLGEGCAHSLMNALARSLSSSYAGLLFGQEFGGAKFDMAIHQHAGSIIIEFEPASEAPEASALDIARSLIARTAALADLAAVARLAPRFVQTLLGFDRVMLYQFAGDGSGKVIGEAKRADLESFLGQHFPASDIPQQARALYLKNAIRVIADVNGVGRKIEPERDASGQPLDLSFAHLRSVSPIHLEYLRNMGVAASMSLSIIVDGELWGLVACHHYTPRTVTMVHRIASAMFVEFLSQHLVVLDNRQRFDAALRTRRQLDALVSEMSFQETIDVFLRDRLAELAQLIPNDGVGVWLNGVWTSIGSTPPASQIPALAKLVGAQQDTAIWATHHLAQKLPGAEDYAAQAAGAMAIPLSQIPRDYLFFFRQEQVRTLEWGGDPNKTYPSGPLGDRLTPRKSFAIWKELVEGQSLPWSVEHRYLAEAMQVGLRDILMRQNEILSEERRRSEAHQQILNDELNHRVKNILALIKSLVSQPAEGTLEDYIASLNGRIMALSFAHDQVVHSDGGSSLHRLLTAELSPYPENQVLLDGEDVMVDARAFSVMALVIHELATNAVKHGALSVPEGRLTVNWRINDLGDLELEWSESNGPYTKPPTRQGFGSILLQRSVPFDLNGTSDIRYEGAGLKAAFVIPSRHVSAGSRPGTQSPPKAAQLHWSDFSLQDRTVLLVEDQLVIALDVEDMLRDLGARVLTAPSAEEALGVLSRSSPDCAVLDVTLGKGTSLPVAEELEKRGIGYVFATGYDDTTMLPERFRLVPIVRKPYDEHVLQDALCKVIKQRL